MRRYRYGYGKWDQAAPGQHSERRCAYCFVPLKFVAGRHVEITRAVWEATARGEPQQAVGARARVAVAASCCAHPCPRRIEHGPSQARRSGRRQPERRAGREQGGGRSSRRSRRLRGWDDTDVQSQECARWAPASPFVGTALHEMPYGRALTRDFVTAAAPGARREQITSPYQLPSSPSSLSSAAHRAARSWRPFSAAAIIAASYTRPFRSGRGRPIAGRPGDRRQSRPRAAGRSGGRPSRPCPQLRRAPSRAHASTRRARAIASSSISSTQSPSRCRSSPARLSISREE